MSVSELGAESTGPTKSTVGTACGFWRS